MAEIETNIEDLLGTSEYCIYNKNDSSFVVLPNRTKIAILMVVMIIALILSIILVIFYRKFPFSAIPYGSLLALVSICYLLKFSIILYNKSPLIEINSKGIIIKSIFLASKFLAWDDINSIKVVTCKGQHNIGIIVNNSDTLKHKLSFLDRLFMSSNIKFYGVHLIYPTFFLPVDCEKLVTVTNVFLCKSNSSLN